MPDGEPYRCSAPIFCAYFLIKSFRILLSALNFSEISIDSGSIVNGLSNVVMYGDGLSLKSEH